MEQRPDPDWLLSQYGSTLDDMTVNYGNTDNNLALQWSSITDDPSLAVRRTRRTAKGALALHRRDRKWRTAGRGRGDGALPVNRQLLTTTHVPLSGTGTSSPEPTAGNDDYSAWPWESVLATVLNIPIPDRNEVTGESWLTISHDGQGGPVRT